MSFDWKNLVTGMAPMVATAFGGPFAGLAVRELSQAILGRPDGSESDISEVLASGNPDALLKLKEAEQNFRARMKELDIKEEQLHATDRASARAREIAVKDKLVPVLAMIILIGFFVTVGYVLSGSVDLTGEQAVLIGTLVGYVSAKAEQVVAYYFGSSKGSADKNKMFERMGK